MSSSAQPTLETTQQGMEYVNNLFNAEVFGKRNFDALDQIYTIDARILPPGAPMISGRTEIKQFWTNFITSTNATAGVLESVDVITAGESAVEIGRATLTINPSGQAESQVEVKYVVHWKQEDGKWKWNIDIWNPNA